MLSEKITYLLKKLDVENSVIAGYAGCTPANFCRLKSGSRSYSEKSTTVKKFTEGIYSFCCDSGKLDELCTMVGAASTDERILTAGLLGWLFDEQALPEDVGDKDDTKLFGKKLCALMDVARISNSKLSKELSIDASYVSRMRGGERVPKKSTGMMVRLCSVLAERIVEQGKQRELGDLIGARVSEAEMADIIYVWLYDRGMPANVQAVRSFIARMNAIPADSMTETDIPGLPEIPIMDVYMGDKGLQQAVVRFLGGVIREQSREIKLYSDNNIDWMTGDFKKLWSAMMAACLKNGTHIKIIHNVERSVNEMIQAIVSWMPLYLTGLIEPYYSTRPAGDRFTCTLFIDQERACVQSFGVRDMSDEAEYNYLTDQKSLERSGKSFEALLSKCRPLLKVAPVSAPPPSAEVCRIGSVQLCIEDSSVTVNKLDEPSAAFTFTYAPMCRAFRSFADTVKESKE